MRRVHHFHRAVALANGRTLLQSRRSTSSRSARSRRPGPPRGCPRCRRFRSRRRLLSGRCRRPPCGRRQARTGRTAGPGRPTSCRHRRTSRSRRRWRTFAGLSLASSVSPHRCMDRRTGDLDRFRGATVSGIDHHREDHFLDFRRGRAMVEGALDMETEAVLGPPLRQARRSPRSSVRAS